MLPWPPRRSPRAMAAVDEGAVDELEGGSGLHRHDPSEEPAERGYGRRARAGEGADARTRAGLAAARFAGDEEANRARRSALLS